MKYSKFQLATMCVYAAVGIQALGAAYAALTLVGTWREFAFEGVSLAQILGPSLIWTGALAVAGIWSVKELKAEHALGWVGCIGVLVFTTASFAFVPSILGLLCLADQEVRGKFLKQLDIKI